MEDFRVMFWPFSIPIVAIVGAFVYLIVATIAKNRVRELEVRERIAMIERGLVPPPEVDPRGFDRAMNRYDRYRDRFGAWPGRAPRRYRSVGITLMGIGFGLMLLIGVAGESMSAAIGVGGFLVIIGIAFFINSLFDNRAEPPAPAPGSFGAPSSIPPGPVDSPRRD